MENRILITRPGNFFNELADFHSRRLEVISSDSSPITLQNGARVVLHLIPQAALDRSLSVDLLSLERPLFPLFCGGGSWRFNFDGRLNYSNGNDGVRSYVQLFHTGIIEAVYVFAERNDTRMIPSNALERNLIEATESYLTAQRNLNVKLPVAILMTLSGVKGFELAVGESFWSYDRYPVDRDTLSVPECLIESFDAGVGREMKPIFDRIWNAAGFPACLHYDAKGNWMG